MNGGVERSVPVRTLLTWLTRVTPDDAMAAVSGCGLDDGHAETLFPIDGIIPQEAVLLLRDGRRVNLRAMPDGAVVDQRPGHPLLAAIEAARSPADRQAAEVAARLRRLRVEADRLASPEDRSAVLQFLECVVAEEVPGEPLLRHFYEAMRRSGDDRHYRRAAEALQAVQAAHAAVPESLLWRLAWMLYHAGQIEQAITLTASPAANRVSGMHRAYLMTIRAAALAALAEIRHDRTLLDEGQAAAQVAYAIDGRSDEIRTVYRTLDRVRARLDAGAGRPR